MTDDVAHELADRLNIAKITLEPQKEWDHQVLENSERITDTVNSTIKSQTERLQVKDLMVQLREKTEALEATFDEIDQIEAVVQIVKETYNKMAASVDDMEKAVMASTSSGFALFQKRNEALQPYFPPPLPVDIYTTSNLFPMSATGADADTADVAPPKQD